ncbi:alpha/beta hydrolase [Massilia forsythiae]|uniref:Alpha/beta hydrolase n=1 Tax=Massilia forsythiae TaxID=2728020 RepID=A0A7Z2VYB6_9BURK|nr:alpha/beta fold hydrolase [Massilia forsythiae]QJE01688.1 alpha/beta hydrolase [Massilia forsythiae]
MSGAAPARRTPLLMIHGLLGPIDYFDPARGLPQLDIHTPDMAGYSCRRVDTEGIDLPGQAAALARYLRERIGRPSWLLGHSVGGAVAMMVADLEPDLVRGLVSVEGNFTLRDAFWCARIARLDEAEWALEYGAMEDAPAAWLEKNGIEAGDERLRWAREILANQPYTTVQSMARSVVSATGAPDWLDLVRRVLVRGTPLVLFAGELSAAGWDVPEWVLAAARRVVAQPKTGHMMMLEDPANFCRMLGAIVEGEAGATPPPDMDVLNEARQR